MLIQVKLRVDNNVIFLLDSTNYSTITWRLTFEIKKFRPNKISLITKPSSSLKSTRQINRAEPKDSLTLLEPHTMYVRTCMHTIIYIVNIHTYMIYTPMKITHVNTPFVPSRYSSFYYYTLKIILIKRHIHTYYIPPSSSLPAQ